MRKVVDVQSAGAPIRRIELEDGSIVGDAKQVVDLIGQYCVK